MKRIVFVLCLLALVMSACAPKTVEKTVYVDKPVEVKVEVPAKVTHLRWLTELDQTASTWLAQEYRKKTNGAVDIEIVFTQSPDGTTAEIQALFAAGQPPDIYTGYGGRTDQYFDIAVPITIEESAYIPGILDVCKNSAGKVVAVPAYYWVQCGGLNIRMIKEYGLEQYVPADSTWTLDEFEAMVKAFDAKKKPGEYAVFFYAASGSGDYWMQLYEKGFGGYPLYNKGKLDVNNPAMLAAWTWERAMIDRGLAPKGAEGLNDDHMIAAFNDDKVLFHGAAAGSANSLLVSYPSVDGSFVPLAIGPSSTVGISGYGKDAEVKAFVEWLSLVPQAKVMVAALQWVPRLDMPMPEFDCKTVANAKPEECEMFTKQFEFVKAALKTAGAMDMGIGSVHYQAIRKLRAQKLAECFAGKDPATALAEFQAEGDAILK